MRPFFIIFSLFIIIGVGAQTLVETLPAPVVHAHSFEILANSRYSVHSGFTSSLPTQVLSNILWAMEKVPRIGTYREIYIATPSNVYRYDPQAHALILHLTGNRRSNSNAAFEIGIATDRYEEAGFAIQVGQLAACAFWDTVASNAVSCPMQSATNYANNNWSPNYPIRMVNVYGQRIATGLKDTSIAISSDTSLPLPRATGSDTFEILLSNLRQDSVFGLTGLSLNTISQLLWASYGVTPHLTSNNRRGLTVPSAVANYYLTGKIYVVRDIGVYRYHNRLPPGNNLTTADHRLELLTSGDRRPALRAASPRIPSTAPVYFVINVGDTASNYNMLEAGFAGIQLLIQAQSLGLNGFLTVPLTPTERTAIRTALNLPSSDFPVILFSCGEPVTKINESLPVNLRIRPTSPNRTPIRFEYWLAKAGIVQILIYDLAGRPVSNLGKTFQSAGFHSLDWNGRDNSGSLLPPGIYLLELKVEGQRTIRKIIKI